MVAVVRITDGAHVRLSGFTVTGPIPCSVEGNGIRVMNIGRALGRIRCATCVSRPSTPTTEAQTTKKAKSERKTSQGLRDIEPRQGADHIKGGKVMLGNPKIGDTK